MKRKHRRKFSIRKETSTERGKRHKKPEVQKAVDYIVAVCGQKDM